MEYLIPVENMEFRLAVLKKIAASSWLEETRSDIFAEREVCDDPCHYLFAVQKVVSFELFYKYLIINLLQIFLLYF